MPLGSCATCHVCLTDASVPLPPPLLAADTNAWYHAAKTYKPGTVTDVGIWGGQGAGEQWRGPAIEHPLPTRHCLAVDPSGRHCRLCYTLPHGKPQTPHCTPATRQHAYSARTQARRHQPRAPSTLAPQFAGGVLYSSAFVTLKDGPVLVTTPEFKAGGWRCAARVPVGLRCPKVHLH